MDADSDGAISAGDTLLYSIILTNSGAGARTFPTLVKALLGETGVPFAWEYNPVLPLKP